MSSEIGWLIRYASPLRSLLTADLLCMILGSALSLVDPLIMKWLIDVALPSHTLRLVFLGTLAFCLIYLASLGLNSLSSFLSCLMTQKLVFRIRISMLRKLHRLPVGQRGRNVASDTLFRMEQDVDRVAELSGDILPLTVQMLVMGLMVLVTMATLNWHLTLLVAPILPLFYLVQRRYAMKLKDAADSVQRQSGKINAFLQEHLRAIAQVQLLNRTSGRTARFARLTALGARLQVEQRATETAFGGASVSLIVIGVGLILGYGGYEVTRGVMTVGGLVAFYGYVFRLFTPVSIAIDLQSRLQRVGASIRRILEITESPFAVLPRNLVPMPAELRPDLEFRSVSFSYAEGRRCVLRNMSFRVGPEETVALVGLNGCGKSTIGLLATGLYEPDAGSILISGKDIREISRRSLLSTINLIPQDPILFDDSIRENLLFGNPRATAVDLDQVAELTQLAPVLRRLPRGLDEPLGSLGTKLSGGEKKRLALARTLLQQPRILVVDEITSSLDAPSATAILKALEHFRRGCTLIVVSHRPSTILWADRILVVDDGQVVDSGKHAELTLRCPAYRRIWNAQDYQAVPIKQTNSTAELGVVG